MYVWNRIHKIKDIYTANTFYHLNGNDGDGTSHRGNATALAYKISSSVFSTDVFTSFRNNIENILVFPSENTETYNWSFSVEDLQEALRRAQLHLLKSPKLFVIFLLTEETNSNSSSYVW